MADDVDKAGTLTEFTEAVALEEYRRRQRSKLPPISEFFCIECGGEIPEERRKAILVERCVECQMLLERKGEV